MLNTCNAYLYADINFSNEVEGRCKREEEFGWCLFGEKSFMDIFCRMTQNTPDKNEVVKWKLKIDKDIKEEGLYI